MINPRNVIKKCNAFSAGRKTFTVHSRMSKRCRENVLSKVQLRLSLPITIRQAYVSSIVLLLTNFIIDVSQPCLNCLRLHYFPIQSSLIKSFLYTSLILEAALHPTSYIKLQFVNHIFGMTSVAPDCIWHSWGMTHTLKVNSCHMAEVVERELLSPLMCRFSRCMCCTYST